MENKASGLVDQFKSLFKKDKFEGELKEAIAQCEANPQDLRLKIRLGELYFKKRDVPNGVATFREVAESYIHEGFFLKAVAIYKNIIRMAPGSVEFNEKLAELYQQLGMNKDAINQYLIVINFYQNHNEKEKVLKSAEHMAAVDPHDLQNRMRLAEIYYNQGLHAEALQEYEKIGNELKEQGGKQLGLLIDVLENIFFRRPKDMGLLKEICILYLKHREPQAAMKKIEKYRLTEEGDFKKIYEKAKEIAEHEQHKKEVPPPEAGA
ncbi:MAG: tetratricopeptide repeat protein [bacterium]